MNSQAEVKTVETNITMQPTINVAEPVLDVKTPVINIDKPQITVSPIINLKSEDLVWNEQGHIILPAINVVLTININ